MNQVVKRTFEEALEAFKKLAEMGDAKALREFVPPSLRKGLREVVAIEHPGCVHLAFGTRDQAESFLKGTFNVEKPISRIVDSPSAVDSLTIAERPLKFNTSSGKLPTVLSDYVAGYDLVARKGFCRGPVNIRHSEQALSVHTVAIETPLNAKTFGDAFGCKVVKSTNIIDVDDALTDLACKASSIRRMAH